MAAITKDTQVEAVGILDRMLEVVDNDMLAHEGYISPKIKRPDLAEQGAVCGGHNACAIGSLYLAAGVRPQRARGGYYGGPLIDRWCMPTTIEPDVRLDFIRGKPALAMAYWALNDAATEYVEIHDLELDLESWGTENELEALFETNPTGEDDGYLIEPSELRPVIVRAQELIHEQATI